jgi:hypothetical protein
MKKNRMSLPALLFTAALQGCNGVNLIQSIEPALGQSPALDRQLTFHVKGSGTCGRIGIDWGDGAMEDVFPGQTTSCQVQTDTAGRKRFQCDVAHIFSGWSGGKTVTATAIAGCEGRVSTRFTTPPAVLIIPFTRPGPNACDAVPGRPALANWTLVKITTVPTNTPCGGIFYNNVTPHCYDAEGGGVAMPPPTVPPGGAPPPVFPFVGMRMFSLVLRIGGTQLEQGGTNMSFTTKQAGRLELCVNEPDPQAGNGGYEIHIATDQLGPPPP